MIRGTTPTHIFNIPLDVSLIKECRVLYSQDNTLLVKKYTHDCVIYDKQVKVRLSQEDTFKFEDDKIVQVQLRVLTTDGEVFGTRITKFDADMCLDDEVLE